MSIESLQNFIKRVFFNRTAQFFVGAQWILLILALISRYNKFGTLSGFTGHIHDEPILVSIFLILNLPALFIMLAALLLLLGVLSILPNQWLDDFSLNISEKYTAIPFVIIFILCLSLQWALIGYGIHKLFHRKHK